MQILRKTNLDALKKAKKIGSEGVLKLLEKKSLKGRGGANFPTAKKWRMAMHDSPRYLICNADEGEPGTFKDKFIIKNNPELLIEGMLIAAFTIGVEQSYIYLRGEYEYLASNLRKVVNKLLDKSVSKLKIDIVVGAGSYVCGEETAIMESIHGKRPHPYVKPPFPTQSGLFGKPTVLNNVETLANVPLAILFDDYDPELRLMSLSGNVANPGVYELPEGVNLCDLIKLGKPKSKPKAVYFGCFGGCMPYCDIELSPQKVCGKNCIIGAHTIIVIDSSQSILDLSIAIARFYWHESCGKCTPCREGTIRILNLLKDIKSGHASEEDLDTLKDLAENIHETSLCGLGQTCTNHILNALKYFPEEFKIR